MAEEKLLNSIFKEVSVPFNTDWNPMTVDLQKLNCKKWEIIKCYSQHPSQVENNLSPKTTVLFAATVQ